MLAAQAEPRPPLQTSPLLRELTRGIAEGHPWLETPKPELSLEEHYAQGLFPIHHERWQKFPGGESLDDLQKRAKEAVNEIIMPYIKAMVEGCPRRVHLAVASHGLLIAEMIPILLELSTRPVGEGPAYRRMKNSGWARITIELDVSLSTHSVTTRAHPSKENNGGSQLPIIVTMTDFDRHEHLDKVSAIVWLRPVHSPQYHILPSSQSQLTQEKGMPFRRILSASCNA